VAIPRVVAVLSGIPAIAPLAMAAYASAEPLWAPIPSARPALPGHAVTGLSLSIVVLSCILVVASIILAYRLPSVDPSKRGAWLMFLLFGSVFAIPIFWYLHIFRDPPAYASSDDP
jgi:hypothetical protein